MAKPGKCSPPTKPPLKPFEKHAHTLKLNKRLGPDKNRDFRITLLLDGNTHSTFELKAKPQRTQPRDLKIARKL
ncbi:MAG: hypothetical protein LBD01_02875 [Puniceicoccales bacterium]|jgi:hypothetical protein|nr:hypothetical protein [Puniceicoccales bacterium]